MTRPLLLDLFCGAGGAAMGYNRAGFDVVGVDINPQPHYPFEFWQTDAMDVLECQRVAHRTFDQFDVVHASPPCQRWLGVPLALGAAVYPDLLTPTLKTLASLGRPYVVENIPTAPLPEAFVLCGATFGLPLIRHRAFHVSPRLGLVPSSCYARSFGRSTSHGPAFYPYAHGAWRPAWREHVMPVVWPWMTIEETQEAIPPAYTEFIGAQLLEHLERAA